MDGQTDNQQRKFSELDVAWLGGFIDGEGSIGIKVQKYMHNKSVLYVAPYVQVVNTNQEALERVDSILTQLHIGHYFDWPKPRKAPHGKNSIQEYKPLWRMLVNGLNRCHAFIPIILPHLTVKRDNAEIVLEFIESRWVNYFKHQPYSTRELEIINRYRRIMPRTKLDKDISLKSLNDYTQETH